MAKLTWHGHSCFTLVTDNGLYLMFDPWLNENPKADISTDDVDRLDYILVSHGHFDHFADGVELARKTGATIIGAFELCAFAEQQGVEKTHKLSIGGGFHFPFGYAKMTPALHGSNVVGDREGTFSSPPGGWWLDMAGKRMYHAGDTALIMEMQLLRGRVDLALLPIGDNFTMGPEDAAAAVEMIRPATVIPMHYNTFDVIAQDPAAFAERIGDTARVVILQPGESHEF